MAQSLSNILVHIVFRVKNTSCLIREVDIEELSKYIGGLIKECDSNPIIVNGVKDHMHVLCAMSKNISLAKLVEFIKRNSSRWIKTKGEYYSNFVWQGGYAGFSVSPSLRHKTKEYILNQKDHHIKRSFKEEYLLFLEEYEIDYNDAYIFED